MGSFDTSVSRTISDRVEKKHEKYQIFGIPFIFESYMQRTLLRSETYYLLSSEKRIGSAVIMDTHLHEIELIKDSVMEYVDGVIEFDFPKGMNPWHPDGLKMSYDSEQCALVRETILETKPDLSNEEIETARKTIKQKGIIEFVDRTGNAASVKLLWLAERGRTCREHTDYILLLKIGPEWKIVSKISHSNEI